MAHQPYNDIRTRISEPPRWYDENGVPRYNPFAPEDAGGAEGCEEVALVEIACQNCKTRFQVAVSVSRIERLLKWRNGAMRLSGTEVADQIRDGSLHYGDPPNTGCCPAGSSMNCLDLRVLQYWWRAPNGKFGTIWRREESLEVALPDLEDLEG